MNSSLQHPPNAHRVTCSQTIARAVVELGVTHVFGLMGDGNMELFGDLDRAGVTVVETRHENAAVTMAEGFGWVSRSVGICSVTHGPGLTQVATALVAAARNHSPVLLIVGETPSGYQGAQRFDQERFVKACELDYHRIDPGDDPGTVLRSAATTALAHRRPLVVAVASDLLPAPAGSNAAPIDAPAPLRPGERENRAAARALAEALEASERPVLVAGRGACEPATASMLMQVADRLGAGLATTIPAKGAFDGHVANLGICGGLAHPLAEHTLREADLVVAVGASLSRATTRSMRMFPSARVIQVVDERQGSADGDQSVGSGADGRVRVLFADATATLVRLLELVDHGRTGTAPWFGEIPAPEEGWRQDLADVAPATSPGTVDPRVALGEINHAIPDGATVVISNGHCSGFSATFIERPRDGQFFAAQGFGAIGQTFTAAVGVALGSPGRKVVCFEGDAGFMMHAQELETAVRAGADVTLVVINDEALGTEYQRLSAAGADAALAAVSTPDLAAFARVLGARGYTVTEPDVIPDAARAALRPGPSLIDLRTNRSILSRHMRRPRH